jgi:aspartyl-tRNA(Asn)/glutamyl-tRNA(Gln) amidotransferase subunit C
MSLPIDQVKRIAHLARIAVTDAEAAAVQTDLNRIFALIEEMNAVDTTGIEPMAHARDLTVRLREDEVRERDQHVAFQAVAPHVEEALYLVPKVIE